MNRQSLLTESVKKIRDPVHGYITLSKLEKTIVDSPPFQRLKDIRQLTCQQVYPAARHTRFEHSLGVLELTKRAIIKLMENGILEKDSSFSMLEIKDDEIYSTQMAALLHDVGHCPFSHMGEAEINKNEAKERLAQAFEKSNLPGLSNESKFYHDVNKFNKAAPHEILSCIIILEKFKTIIDNGMKEYNVDIDYELIIRCIIGMKYEITRKDYMNSIGSEVKESNETVIEKRRKNLLVDLINSNMLDMDKIDYIMRDAYFTGIEVPKIDARQLFLNMHVSSEFELRFTSRAVPILQNLITARDDLYLWVYNHHTCVFSDFLYKYIIRRFEHNARDEALEKNEDKKYAIGEIPRTHLFSVDAIVDDGMSDSDWIHTLNSQLRDYKKNRNLIDENQAEVSVIRKKRALDFIITLNSRNFLKSWWKRPFEFRAYLNKNFPNNDNLQKELIERISSSGDEFDSTEFRSQFAKHVFHLVNHYRNDDNVVLADGDFFIVPRANKFFGQKDIEQLVICLKSNEVINSAQSDEVEFYTQPLTALMPQKNYEGMFDKNGFFLYVRRFDEEIEKRNISKTEYYTLIDSAFVFVAKQFTAMAKEEFMALFIEDDSHSQNSQQLTKENKKLNEKSSNNRMLEKFKKINIPGVKR